jgi:hypothetical protein
VQPQPRDGQTLSEIPYKITGTYRFQKDPNSLTKIIFSKNKIEYYEEKENTISKKICFKEQDRYYTIIDQKKTEMYNPVFFEDSVNFKYALPLDFDLGQNLIVKDLVHSLVFNIKTGDNSGWLPAQLVINGDMAAMYLIKDEITDKWKIKGESEISKNLEAIDFEYYQKRKEEFLDEYLYFDLKSKLFWGAKDK